MLFSGDTARSQCTFLAIINSLKLTNINGGRYKAKKIIKNTGPEITKSFLEIVHMTIAGKSNIVRRVSSLRLVTDVR